MRQSHWTFVASLVVLTVVADSAHPARAQATGELDPTSSLAGSRVAYGRRQLYGADLTRRQQQDFAALVLDPSLSGSMRSSSWAFSVVAQEAGKEARLQANLCDVVACGGRSAIDLLLAGPIDERTRLSELATLEGLAGTARLEGGWTHNLTNATGEPSFDLRGVLGHPHFAYRSIPSLADNAVDRTVYSMRIGMGVKRPDRAIQAGLRYENGYYARPSQNVCQPANFGVGGTETCTDIIVGAPRRKLATVADVEIRKSIGGVAGVRLTLSRDFRNRVTGIDLPIYVVPNVSGALSGGARLGYRSDTRHLGVGLFVSAFKL